MQADSYVGRQNRQSSRAANQYEADDGHRRAQGFWADVAGLAPRLPCLVCYFRFAHEWLDLE